MNKSIRILILVVVVAGLAAGGWYYWGRRRGVTQNPQPAKQDHATAVPLGSSVAVESVGDPVDKQQLAAEAKGQATAAELPKLSEQQQEQMSIGHIARAFAERMGSYSPTSNYSNIREAFPMMSPSMRTTAEGIISRGGNTTQTLRTTGISVNENKDAAAAGRRVFTVIAQREKRVDGANVSVTVYQKATVTMVSVDSAWLADSISWGEENDI